ncbi:MAG: hypothetical protein GY910_15640 [bacterium]|nr:hypothetical protein [bacterium]
MRFLSSVLSLAFALCVASAAQAAPAGAIFHSDFEDYAADWRVLPWVPAPDFTQLPASTLVESASGEAYGRFDTLGVTPLDQSLIGDLEISLALDSLEADRMTFHAAWFAGNQWIRSARVLSIDHGTSVAGVTFTRAMSELAAPAAADGFSLVSFVYNGSATFDEVSVAPVVSTANPEPSSALLIGLGLISLGAQRARRPAR